MAVIRIAGTTISTYSPPKTRPFVRTTLGPRPAPPPSGPVEVSQREMDDYFKSFTPRPPPTRQEKEEMIIDLQLEELVARRAARSRDD